MIRQLKGVRSCNNTYYLIRCFHGEAITNGVTAGNYIRITSNTESGLSPPEATLSLESSLDLTNASLTYEGPGQVEFLSTSTSEYRVRMTTEGIYYFTANVSDPSGNLYSDTVAITVLSEAYLDGLLRGKWEAMKGALSQGDIERTIGYFDDSTKSGYKEHFSVLSPMLLQIVQDLSDIQFIEMIKNAVEYDIRTIRDGVEYSFYLLFVKDKDGLWKIRSF